jgi:hypothetical protein
MSTAVRDLERDDISLINSATSATHYASSEQTESSRRKLSNTAMGCFAICVLIFGAMTLADLSSGELF